MDYKKSLLYLAVSLLLSPVVVYIVLIAAGAAGASYEMASYGDRDQPVYYPKGIIYGIIPKAILSIN